MNQRLRCLVTPRALEVADGRIRVTAQESR